MKRVKAKMTKEGDLHVHEKNHLTSLTQQGQMMRALNEKNASVWSHVVTSLPDRIMKFAINASLETLPTNSNLFKWKKINNPCCSLCQSPNQSLLYVLNLCPVALNLRQFNKSHDGVVEVLASWINDHIPLTANVIVDLPNSEYNFPTHIVKRTDCPDIIWWDENQNVFNIIELTIPYETNINNAADHKEGKYTELLTPAKDNGYQSTPVTLEVGSIGLINEAGFKDLKKLLNPSPKKFRTLLEQCSRQAIIGSFSIWCSRNSSKP